ncbi:unnamed protein product [Microthlaspi erraticum]|uniref:Uncharacterized protein n=1 Tax=Microthlaspi erraticum TaxID=1685480 RepID=A0A6D2J1U7_9BRAS|nr:unnamed protein product [Microthlaspi erraticum]
MSWSILKLLMFQSLFTSPPLGEDGGYDFFYFVLQWPGAYCDTTRSCCYPTSGKPEADFGINGLLPNRNDGTYPSNCDPDSELDRSQISDLISSLTKKWPKLSCPSNEGFELWKRAWSKQGTCAQNIMSQHGYFQAALRFKDQIDLLQILTNSGIKPDDGFYGLKEITNAIEEAIGFTPGIDCNKDPEGNDQLYHIYVCVDYSATRFIECPVWPGGRTCSPQIQFAKF